MDNINYPLSSKQRLEYQFMRDNIKYNLSITAEHRVEIKKSESNEPFKFYMRKKPPRVRFFERVSEFWKWVTK
jgi:hypothetical protein